MAMKILEKRSNPLLEREEYWIKIEHSGKATPARKDMQSFIAKELKSSEEKVIIDKIFTLRGEASSKVKTFIYKKKESIPNHLMEKMERRTGEKKEGASKPEERGKEEKPEETPKEKLNDKKEEAGASQEKKGISG